MRKLGMATLLASMAAGMIVGWAAGPLPAVLVFTSFTALGTAVLGAWAHHRAERAAGRVLVPVPVYRVVRQDRPVRERR